MPLPLGDGIHDKVSYLLHIGFSGRSGCSCCSATQ